MVADDNAINLQDNINTRDQNRAGVWLIIVVVIFVAFLAALGMGHAPEQAASGGAGQAEPVGGGEQGSESSVTSPVGEVELPGTVGQPQNFVLNGHGNTPAPYAAATTTGAQSGPQSGQSGAAPTTAAPNAAPAAAGASK
jgi:hypothetical protein